MIILAIWLIPTESGARIAKDQLGRQVAIPDHPTRIVSLAPSITEILFAIGQGERVKGVTAYSDYPDAATRLPKVGSYVHLDVERIVALKPDLCIAIKDGNPVAVIQRLESVNIPVYAVNPRNFDSIIRTLHELGSVLNAPKSADSLAQSMQARIHRIQERIQSTPKRPGVFFQIGITPIVSVGTDTFIHQLIEIAGGRNLTAGPIPYPRLSREQILDLNPDIMIITSMTRDTTFEAVKAEWQAWPKLSAVKNDRIHLVDSNVFDRPTPRLVEALELLARLIHPDLFKESP